MKINQSISLLLVITSTIALTQCLCCAKQEYNNIDQELVDLYRFKNGSYWVYADSMGNTDSMWVEGYRDSSHVSEIREKCGSPLILFFSYKIKSSNNSALNKFVSVHPSKNYPNIPSGITEVNNDGTLAQSWALLYDGDSFSSISNNLTFYKEDTILGQRFEDIYYMLPFSTSDRNHIAISNKIGIISYGNRDNPYQLIRYHLEK